MQDLGHGVRQMVHLPEREVLGDLGTSAVRAGAGIALVGFAATAFIALSPAGGAERFFFSYLHNIVYFLSLSLGALFFVLVTHATGATWSVPVRRLAEAAAANVATVAVFFIPVFFGLNHLYHWTDAAAVAADATLRGKAGWLNVPFFLARTVVYFAAWIALSRSFLARSRAQDASGDPALTHRMQRTAAPGLVLFAFTLTFAAFDFLMSLDPHWYSTIFGVYFFAGSVVSANALLPLLARLLQSRGRLTRIVDIRHYHDMGNMTFAFTVFWAYIAFSQFMLIWYANLPEETEWYYRRIHGGWEAIGWLLLFGHFVIPFLVLMSRYVKRRPVLLVSGAVWVLVMHWFDLYWVVMPEASPSRNLGPMDLACFVALAGVYVAGGAWILGRGGLFAARDPRLSDALAAEGA